MKSPARPWKLLCALIIASPLLLDATPLAFATLAHASTSTTQVKDGPAQIKDSPALVKDSKVGKPRDTFKAERETYQAAQRAWRAGNRDEYATLKAKLSGYPLLDYLEFNEIEPRLAQLPLADIDAFLARHGESISSARVRYRTLAQLAKRERWADYIRYFHPAMQETEQRCHYLYARLVTGDKTALDEVAPLWNIDKTQIKSCDPLFALWRKAGGQTPELVWQRLLKVSARQDRALADFLARQLPTSYQPAIKRLASSQANARAISTGSWRVNSAADRDAIIFAIERLARTDASAANTAWNKYAKAAGFTQTQAAGVRKNIALRKMWQKNADGARALAEAHPDIRDGDLIEAILRDHLRSLNFTEVNRWLDFLPQELQQHERWRYWRLRAMQELGISEHQGATPEALLQQLAMTRSYYGFIASDLLNQPYSLQDKPVQFTREQLRQVQTNPSVMRAREHFLLGDTLAANREWSYALRKFEPHQRAIAGRVAVSWQWYRQGIQAMIQANYWDDLTVRFPTVYEHAVKKNAKATGLSPIFIYSIIRQESAFITDVRSPVGATGLMQLMPATAAETAKRNKIPYTQADLVNPDKNIVLGSRFLQQMMGRFDNNRLLTAAAYNAGPGRVNQWLTAERNLPHDVWVETIPFRETRGYVQNILAFSVIYAHRLGEKAQFMTEAERRQLL